MDMDTARPKTMLEKVIAPIMREDCGDQKATNPITMSPTNAVAIPSNKMRPSVVLNSWRQAGRGGCSGAVVGVGLISTSFTELV